MNFKKYYLIESDDIYFYHGSIYDFDEFDINKVGTGDGLSKFGYGLYFADNEDLAKYYAFNKEKGIIYQVKLYNVKDFFNWEDEAPSEIYDCVIRKLRKLGLNEDADQITQEFEEYNERWNIKNLYNWLKEVLKSEPKTTNFLYTCGIYGVKADDLHGRGKIYVAYSSDLIKIIDKWKT